MTNPTDEISIAMEELENTMTEKIKLHCDPPWDAKCCIFKAPHLLRRHNPEAYQPDFRSNDPFHHRGGKRFQHMDNIKKWYLHNLLSHLDMSLKTLIDRASKFEQDSRAFYADQLDYLNKNEFKGEVDDSIMNKEFNGRVLTIPHLEIGELTESMFMNLIAFEQCYHGRPHEVTSYAVFMDNLISSKDMELLCPQKIVGNWLSPKNGSEYFINLHNDTLLKFYYSGLCVKLNTHYKDKWNTWLEKLKCDYFSNPWTMIALIAVSIALILTVLRTAYSIHPYYSPPQ